MSLKEYKIEKFLRLFIIQTLQLLVQFLSEREFKKWKKNFLAARLRMTLICGPVGSEYIPPEFRS